MEDRPNPLHRLAIGLFADGPHNARSRTALSTRSPHCFQDYLVVGGDCGYSELRFHEDNLVASGLQVVEQIGRGFGRRMLEVVHQHNALTVLLQLRHY